MKSSTLGYMKYPTLCKRIIVNTVSTIFFKGRHRSIFNNKRYKLKNESKEKKRQITEMRINISIIFKKHTSFIIFTNEIT